MEGTVKFFNRRKGFGFVSGDDGKDYFVHFTALGEGTFLRDNDRVSFEAAEGERGLKAEKVALLEKASDRSDLPAEEGSEAPAEETTEEAPAQEEAAPEAEEAAAEETTEEEAAPAEEAPVEEESAPEEETPAEEPATEEETPAEEPAEEETPAEPTEEPTPQAHESFGEKVHHVVDKVEEALHLKKPEE